MDFSKMKDKDWKAYDDAHAIMRAQEVLGDPNRTKKAKAMASEILKDKEKELANLSNVADMAMECVVDLVSKVTEEVFEASKGKKPPLGTGERFKKLVGSLMKKQKMGKEKATAIAAAIGRKKLGKERFQKLAAKGKKKKTR